MDDLLQSQIKESCKLALPNGLKELMSDISREVLRAQPAQLYDFITQYLAALLVTRENLSIACRICKDVCDPSCHPELDDELKNIGLKEEDAVKAKKVIEEYFEKGNVKESTLMVKLLKKTSMSQNQLELVQEAVRDAFVQHHINKTDDTIREMPLDDDPISLAASHTLQLYAETGPTEEDYSQKAQRIQAAYRAYGVRRLCKSKPSPKKEKKNIRFHAETMEADIVFDVSESDTTESSSTMNYDPTKFDESLNHMDLDERSSKEEIITRTIYDMTRPERVQSFINYDEEEEKRKTSTVSEIRFDESESRKTSKHITEERDADNIDSHSDKEDRKSSIVSEVRFSEPLIYETISKEGIDEPDADDMGSINEEPQIYFENTYTELVDDQAINADNDSDASVEELMPNEAMADDLIHVDVHNSYNE